MKSMHSLHDITEFTTEADIRTRAVEEFKARSTAYAAAKKRAEAEGREFPAKPELDPALLDTPQMEKWLSDRVESARKSGRLITKQQLEDLKAGRTLRQGDRCRYVGPTELQNTQAGKSYLRKTGETGRITKALREIDRLIRFTFLPDFDEAALDPDGPDVFIAEYEFKQGTKTYFRFERIPE